MLFTFLLLKHIRHVRNEEQLNQVTLLMKSSKSFCLRVEFWVKLNCSLVFNLVYYSAFEARLHAVNQITQLFELILIMYDLKVLECVVAFEL